MLVNCYAHVFVRVYTCNCHAPIGSLTEIQENSRFGLQLELEFENLICNTDKRTATMETKWKPTRILNS